MSFHLFTRLCDVAVIALASLVPATLFSCDGGFDDLPKKLGSDLDRVVREDLSVFNASIKHYKVGDLRLSEAVRFIWAEALGRAPETIQFTFRSDDEPKVTLELSDTSAKDILRYLCELSATEWTIRGSVRRGFTMCFVAASDCRDHPEKTIHADAMALNAKAVQTLGLPLSGPPMDAREMLKRLGVKFGDLAEDTLASFDPSTQTLTVALPMGEMPFVQSLVRLANADQLKPGPN